MPKKAKVLDAGCGSGRDSALFALRGLDVVGIDLSIGLINIARRENPNITFVHGNFIDMPFSNRQFDGIWANASLVHLETDKEARRALKEFNRVLKKNGIMNILVKAQTGKKKTAVVKDTISNHERFFQYFTVQELETLTEGAGFKKLHIEQYRETDKNPKGRLEVEWIWLLARKV